MQNSNRRSIRLVQISLCLLCQLAFLTAATLHTYAKNGLPQSENFGFGARIDPWGKQVDIALEAASANALHWIGVDFDWSRHWPESNSTLDLTGIDHVMRFAVQHDLAVLLSITNAPAWAKSTVGPDPEITAGLVTQFMRLYPKAVKAIELFPAANTEAGWGAPPDPGAYIRLFQATSAVIHDADNGPVLIAAGLVPVSSSISRLDIDDLEFLQQLYDEGAAEIMPVISVRFTELSGDPLAFPREDGDTTLRRYELVRNQMLRNRHNGGHIWVTGFSWPAGDPNKHASALLDAQSERESMENNQSHWLSHALQIMKSQLYLGAAFHDCLNPPAVTGQPSSAQGCLISTDEGKTHIHPALTSVGYMNTLAEKQQSLGSNSGLENAANRFDLIGLWKAISP